MSNHSICYKRTKNGQKIVNNKGEMQYLIRAITFVFVNLLFISLILFGSHWSRYKQDSEQLIKHPNDRTKT